MNKLGMFSVIQLRFCSSCKRCYKMTVNNAISSSCSRKYNSRFSSNQASVNNDLISKETQNEKAGDERKQEFVKKKDNGKNKLTQKELTYILKYIESKKSLQNVQDIITSALSAHNNFYLMDTTVAKEVSNSIVPELEGGSSVVIEADPGLGLLTEQLLEAGIPYFCLFESNTDFFEYLKVKPFKTPVDVKNKDLVNFWKLQFRETKRQKMSTILSGIPIRKWEDESPLTIISVIPSRKFITDIMDNIVSRSGFVDLGRPQFLLMLDPLIYHSLTCTGEQGYATYKVYTVLFQILFDYKILCKIPRSAFLPIVTNLTKIRGYQQTTLDERNEFMYLVRLTPHKHLYDDSFDRLLPMFRYFLKQLLSSCKTRVIPYIERWFPGCGPQLIANGIYLYTEVGELKPKQILDIFMQFVSVNADDPSSFRASMEAFFLKKHGNDDSENIYEEDE